MSDEDYMRLALDLAERAKWTARPNPMVGAVVVKSGRIVGSGYHAEPGHGHGEVNALSGVSDAVACGATIYVTLEPCNFKGRTPPCSDLLIEKGLARVVCAMADPDSRVSGSGIAKLRAAGVEVEVGVLAEDAERLNRPYLTHRRLGRPYVTLKMAQSLDGSIATVSGDSKWITGDLARRRGHGLRAEAQVIIVGVGTVIADDPELTVRHVDGESPQRVVFDSTLRIPADANVLRDAGTIVCSREDVDPDRVRQLEEQGAEVWKVPEVDGRPSIVEALNRLAERDFIHVLVEGGSQLSSSFLRNKSVDRVAVFSAPKIVGGMPAVLDIGVKMMQDALMLDNVKEESLGSDRLLIADVRYA